MFCFILAAPLSVYADAIAVSNNDFFEKHTDKIIYLGRSFCANGESGSVSVKKAPGARSDLTKLENGEVVYIGFSCLYDGDFWGFAGAFGGWFRLDQMLVLYDYIAFEEEHMGEFYKYEGDFSEIDSVGAAIVWPWPGADAPLWTIEGFNSNTFWVTHAWTDSDGREWVFFDYRSGSRNLWICLSDPVNPDIPVFNPAPAPSVWVSETEHVDIARTGNSSVVPIIVLVAAVAAGTIVLIRIFWRPKKEPRNGEIAS